MLEIMKGFTIAVGTVIALLIPFFIVKLLFPSSFDRAFVGYVMTIMAGWMSYSNATEKLDPVSSHHTET